MAFACFLAVDFYYIFTADAKAWEENVFAHKAS